MYKNHQLFLTWLAVFSVAGNLWLPTVGRAQSIRLFDDFEGDDFSPAGGLFYKKNYEQKAGHVLFQRHVVRYGKKALELSVTGHCTQKDHDCSERAEIWEKKSLQLPYEQEVWYGFSINMPDVPTIAHRYVMAQWKRKILTGAKTPFSPFLALRLNKGKYIFTVDADSMKVFPFGKGARKKGCLAGETLVLNRPGEKQTRALIAMQADMRPTDWRHYNGCTRDIRITQYGDQLPKATAGWVDFAFRIKTGARGDGRIDIFANNKHVATARGKIGHKGNGLGDHQYFKFGPYRAPRPEKWTIYYDRFMRGDKCTDVLEAATCTSLGK